VQTCSDRTFIRRIYIDSIDYRKKFGRPKDRGTRVGWGPRPARLLHDQMETKKLIRNYRQMVTGCTRIGIAFDSSLFCVLFWKSRYTCVLRVYLTVPSYRYKKQKQLNNNILRTRNIRYADRHLLWCVGMCV